MFNTAAGLLQGMSDDDMTVQQFRQRCVDPMGEESDHVHIVALTNALQARLRSDRNSDFFPSFDSVVLRQGALPGCTSQFAF